MSRQLIFEYHQKTKVADVMKRLRHALPLYIDDEIERLTGLGKRNARRSYRRSLKREARVAKLLARMK